jgi:hypothetical protein
MDRLRRLAPIAGMPPAPFTARLPAGIGRAEIRTFIVDGIALP